MAYKALTVVNLPVLEDREIYPGIVVPVPTGDGTRKEPGETITKQEMKDAGMDEEKLAAMLQAGSISEDMKAELHHDHLPVASDGKTKITSEGASTDGQ
jgi:hypothetical protein